jgi:hypothetical protein
MRFWHILLIFLCFPSCQTPPSALDLVKVNYPVRPYNLTAADGLAIELSVRSRLRDPMSAIFGQVSAVIDAKNMITVCGAVNGRNGFGGYTGFVPYMGMLADNMHGNRVFAVTGIASAPSDTSTMAVLMICNKHGAVLR